MKKTVQPAAHILEAAWVARDEADRRARAFLEERRSGNLLDVDLNLEIEHALPLLFLGDALRSVDPSRSAEELLSVAVAEAVARQEGERLRAPSEATRETYAAIIEHPAFVAAAKASRDDRVRAGAERLKRRLTTNPRAAHLFGLSWVVVSALREDREDLRDAAFREMDEVLTARWERIVAACFPARGPVDAEAAWKKWHHIRGAFRPLLVAWNRRAKKVSRFIDTVKATVRDRQSVAVASPGMPGGFVALRKTSRPRPPNERSTECRDPYPKAERPERAAAPPRGASSSADRRSPRKPTPRKVGGGGSKSTASARASSASAGSASTTAKRRSPGSAGTRPTPRRPVRSDARRPRGSRGGTPP